MSAPRRFRARSLLVLGAGLLVAGCKKQRDSLVVVSLTANPPDVTLTVLKLSVENTTQTFALANGVGANPVSYGVYVASSVTGLVDITAVAYGTDNCKGYTGRTTGNLMAAGDTLSVSIPLERGQTCATDAGSDAGSDAAGGAGGAAGAGGTGGTGGGAGGMGGGAGGGGGVGGGTGGGGVVCAEYNHNANTTGACLLANQTGGPQNDASITDIAFSKDGRYLFSAGDDGRIKVWTWNGTTLSPEGHVLTTSLAGISPGGTYLGLSPSGTLIAAGSAFGDINVWNIGGSWTRAAQLSGATGDIFGLAFSPDSQTLYTVDGDSVLSTFTMSSMSRASSLDLRPFPIVLASSPLQSDGTYFLAVGYDDGDASIINVGSAGLGAEQPFSVTPIFAQTWALQFSHDGHFLAAGAADGVAGIWAIPFAQDRPLALRSMAITTDWIDYLAFSPTDATLAIAAGGTNGGRQLGVWDAATGAPRTHFGVTYRPFSVAYAPDGRAIAAGEVDCGIISVCPVN